jgi:hypothetical protein
LLKTRNVYAFIAPLARAGAAASERATKRKTTLLFDERTRLCDL